jgi:hypothetical protein
MSDLITLPRAVLQQALHVATAAAYPVALIAALRAALEQPVQEPVGDSYADLFNALQRIETAAVFLPSFKITHEGGLEAVVQNIVDAIAALAQPVQEPVARVLQTVGQYHTGSFVAEVETVRRLRNGESLYTHPPQRLPLRDEDLDRLWREPMSADWEHREFARAIEAAHGIKENT